jgi:peptidoglycan/LPS O-acetylase OafA/YrhL
MLVASLVILAYDLTIGVGPHAQRSLINLIPSLSFISPAIIHALTGLSIESMDGTFWSLYVEVSFYFVFGLLFFRLGLFAAIGLIFGFSVLACTMGYVASFGLNDGLFGRIAAMLDWLGIVHFGWFASGAMFYEYFRTRRTAFFFVAICLGTVAALDWKPSFFSVTDRIALLTVVGVFAVTICSIRLQSALAARPLVLTGFISYPLYLIHDNISVGLTNLLGRAVPLLPPLLYPVSPIVLVMIAAFLITKYAEPMLRRTLDAWTSTIWMRVPPRYARLGD